MTAKHDLGNPMKIAIAISIAKVRATELNRGRMILRFRFLFRFGVFLEEIRLSDH